MLMQCSIFSFLIFHPSVQCIFIFPPSLSLFISLTLQHTLGCQAAIQTSSEEKLSFLSNTLQSIVSPYVVNKREDTGENHIADDCKWCTTRDTWKRRRKRRRKRKPGANNQAECWCQLLTRRAERRASDMPECWWWTSRPVGRVTAAIKTETSSWYEMQRYRHLQTRDYI